MLWRLLKKWNEENFTFRFPSTKIKYMGFCVLLAFYSSSATKMNVYACEWQLIVIKLLCSNRSGNFSTHLLWAKNTRGASDSKLASDNNDYFVWNSNCSTLIALLQAQQFNTSWNDLFYSTCGRTQTGVAFII